MNDTLALLQPACSIAMARIVQDGNLPISKLPKDMLEKAGELKSERRQQYLTGRILLAELLFQTLGIDTLPTIVTNNNGRPSFGEPNLPDFNISHSGDYIMVALAQNCCVGLDLEIQRPRKRLLDLAKYSFSETEYIWLLERPLNRQEEAFWQLWTVRESILKLAGKGVWQMKKMTIDPYAYRLFAQFSERLYCWSSRQEGIFWTIATDRALAKNHLYLWQASADLSALSLQPQPPLTLFSSESSP